MATVYKAYDCVIGGWVAIKFIRPHLISDGKMVERFKDEFRCTSKISHPNVVRTFDFGTFRGTPYLSMALITGTTLSTVLKMNGPLPARLVTKLAVQICDGLQAAHDAGVLHRDLKPHNILIDNNNHAYIADFGLAGALDTPSRSLTPTGPRPGTGPYMSPEQTLGRELDQRSDIYSLGVLIYELLTGVVPSPDVAIENPASLESCLQIRGVPGALAAAVVRCLRVAPADRYPTARDLRLDLLRVQCGSASRRERWRGRSPRFRSKVVGASGIIAISILGLYICRNVRSVSDQELAFRLNRQAEEILSREPGPLEVERAVQICERAIQNNGRSLHVYVTMVQAAALLYRDTKAPRWLSKAKEAASRAEELGADRPETRLAVARVHLATGRAAAAVKEASAVVQAYPDYDAAYRVLARGQVAIGQGQEALISTQRALAVNPSDWRNGQAHAVTLYTLGRYTEAEQAFKAILQQHPDRADTRANLAAVYLKLGRYSESISVLEKALQLQPRAEIYANIGVAYFLARHYRLSIPMFEKAAALQPESDHPAGNLAEAYRAAGDSAEAIRAYFRAIKLAQQALRANPNDRAVKIRLAFYYVRTEDFLAAEAAARELRAAGENSGEFFYAEALLQLGNHRIASALETLELALQHGFATCRVLADPSWKAVEHESRFQTLVNRPALTSQPSP